MGLHDRKYNEASKDLPRLAERQDIIDFLSTLKSDSWKAHIAAVQAYKDYEFTEEQQKELDKVKDDITAYPTWADSWKEMLVKVAGDVEALLSLTGNMGTLKQEHDNALFALKKQQHDLENGAIVAGKVAYQTALTGTTATGTSDGSGNVVVKGHTFKHTKGKGESEKSAFIAFGDNGAFRVFAAPTNQNAPFEVMPLPKGICEKVTSATKARMLLTTVLTKEHNPDMVKALEEWSTKGKGCEKTDSLGLGVNRALFVDMGSTVEWLARVEKAQEAKAATKGGKAKK